MALSGKRILLIISGGIAAYKSLDLIRRLRERGASVRPVMTSGAQEFVTPLAVGALAADHVFTDLFSRQDEQDVGHIRLARDCDLVLIAPATADLMAKMANGLADDLASTILLATDKPVLAAPAMNPRMWAHPATKRNVATLAGDGIRMIGPMAGGRSRATVTPSASDSAQTSFGGPPIDPWAQARADAAAGTGVPEIENTEAVIAAGTPGTSCRTSMA